MDDTNLSDVADASEGDEGPCKLQEVQNGQMQNPASGSGKSQHQYRLSYEWTESSPVKKDS